MAPTKISKFAVANADSIGVRSYYYHKGTIQELASTGIAGDPGMYYTWTLGFNFGNAPTEIRDVHPESDFAAIGYISPSKRGLIVRVFYQTENGDIRSVLWAGHWSRDETIIAPGLPLGVSISAMQQANGAGQEGIVVQYPDADGRLTQRFSTTDEGNWSVATLVNPS